MTRRTDPDVAWHRLKVVNGGQWYVIVEEHVPRWNGLRYHPADDAEHALVLAQEVALNHAPAYAPQLPRSRSFFRVRDGSWVVNVSGKTSEWHYRVTIAEHFGTQTLT